MGDRRMSYLTDDELTRIREEIIKRINDNVYEIFDTAGNLAGVEETADELCTFLKEYVE